MTCQANRPASPDRRSHIFHFRNIEQEEFVKKYAENFLYPFLQSHDLEGGGGKVGEGREGLRIDSVCLYSQAALYKFNQ